MALKALVTLSIRFNIRTILYLRHHNKPHFMKVLFYSFHFSGGVFIYLFILRTLSTDSNIKTNFCTLTLSKCQRFSTNCSFSDCPSAGEKFPQAFIYLLTFLRHRVWILRRSVQGQRRPPQSSPSAWESSHHSLRFQKTVLGILVSDCFELKENRKYTGNSNDGIVLKKQ